MIWASRHSASLPAAMPPVRLEFVYDYMSRRCVKRLYDRSGEGAAAVGGSAVVEGSAAAVVQSDEEPVAPESGGGVVIPIGWTLTSTFKFVWDGWNLLAELDGEDGVLRTCAWGLDLSGSEQGAGGVGGLVFEYLSKPDTTYHLYYDGNGNVTGLRDDAGALSCEYAYGPFGETLTARGDDAALAYNAFKFSTKYADAESGLLYYGYRYYNPGTGRWLNRDPIEEEGGLCLHAWLMNEGIVRIDPLGLSAVEAQPLPHPDGRHWTFDITAKSYIGPIGTNIGFVGGTSTSIGDLTPTGIGVDMLRLWAFARATDIMFSENPLTTVKDRRYRLYSRIEFDFQCECDTDQISVSRAKRDKDGGKEIGVLNSVTRLDDKKLYGGSWHSTYQDTTSFSIRLLGRPNRLANLGMDLGVGWRRSFGIWHEVRGSIWCANGKGFGEVYWFDGSAFPSHRLWINGGAPTKTIWQGPLSNLWVRDPLDSTIVR